jgi:hypothetical protein
LLLQKTTIARPERRLQAKNNTRNPKKKKKTRVRETQKTFKQKTETHECKIVSTLFIVNVRLAMESTPKKAPFFSLEPSSICKWKKK